MHHSGVELEGYDSDCEEDTPVVSKPAHQNTIEELDLGSLINLQVKLGQSPVLTQASDQTQTLMVKLSETTLNAQEEQLAQATLDLVCLIDCSGSMNGFKLTQVQQTLVYMMEILQPTDRMALVAFNSEAVVLNSLRLATKENKCGRLLSNIQKLTAVGGTNIVGGLRKAVKILKQRKTKNSVSSIFLLGDGNDNFELDGLDSLLEKSNIENLTIHTFGYGEDHDPDSLRKIAEKKSGNFYYIKDLAKVDEAFIDCLSLLTSVIGGKAVAKVTLVPTPMFKEISFKTCYGSYWQGDEDTTREVAIGPIYMGFEKCYLAEIVLDVNQKMEHPKEQLVKVAEIELTLTNLSNEAPKSYTVKRELHITVVSDPAAAVKQDEEVTKHHLRVTGAQVFDTAKQLVNKGNFVDAEKVFQSFRSKFEKVELNDVVLDNLNRQLIIGQQYFHPQQQQQASKPTSSFGFAMPQSFDRKRHMVNYFNENAHTMMCEQSAPELYSDMYQNRRQKRMLGEMKMKK